MCNIIRFLPNQMIDEEKFFNCVYNNWHSYGLVVKDDNKLDITRVVPEAGEVDPKEVWSLLKRYQDVERILHLRHTTAGVTDLENCHPFDVLYVPGKKGRPERQIVFMHNGTMADYKSKITEDGRVKDDNSGPSDTKNFVDQVLIPLTQIDYGTGAGDLSNELFRKVLLKFWIYGNRGVLIANDQPSLFLGEWKEFGTGDILKVANVDYFDKVTRGPEFSRREAANKKPSDTVITASLKDYNFDAKHDFFKLSESPCNILNDWEFYDRAHATSVGYLSAAELREVYDEKTSCLHLMDWVFTDYAALYKEHLEVVEKHEKATKKIAGMAEQLKKLSRAAVQVG